ncbi:MAG: hypothetical protein EBS08_02390 [Cytophagia bacterium]|nr:hypothetical protein [Cytophagia bacterium]
MFWAQDRNRLPQIHPPCNRGHCPRHRSDLRMGLQKSQCPPKEGWLRIPESLRHHHPRCNKSPILLVHHSPQSRRCSYPNLDLPIGP